MNNDTLSEPVDQFNHKCRKLLVFFKQILGIFTQNLVVYLLPNTRLVEKLFAGWSLFVGYRKQ